MDTATLHIFVEVMRRGSFAAVARDRGTDPSTVSRAIAALERDLGIRLFHRTTRRLSPTEAGMVYFERVEPIVDELERARVSAVDLGGTPRGTLRITAPVSYGQLALVPLLPAFAEACPELELEILLTDAVVDLLSERIDVAVRLGPLADSSLVARRLCRMRFAVVASPAYLARNGRPAAPRELRDHNCLRFPMAGYRSRWRFRNPAGKTVEVPVRGRLVISNALALGQCAAAGMGVTLLPRWVVADALAEGRLVDLFPDWEATATDFDTSAWLVYPSRRYLPCKVRAFVDFVARRMGGAASGGTSAGAPAGR